MKKKKVTEQKFLDIEEITNGLDGGLADSSVALNGTVTSQKVLPPVQFKTLVGTPKRQKTIHPLTTSSHPSVTLHKGGGLIVVTPNDVHAAIAITEIRDRLKQIANPITTLDKEKLELQLLPDVSVQDFNRSVRVWSLIGKPLDKHPMAKLLSRYGLDVQMSPSLSGWLKKQERKLTRELTPFLLPDFKDERSLFEKVEAGMVLTCTKDMDVDKQTVFNKGNRYQILDTARGAGNDDENHTDGLVKISRTAVSPNAKITLDEATIFSWTPFHGDMESFFHYDEKIIYDPKKCMPKKYPDLLSMYTKRLENMGLELYDHVTVDVVQEAAKNSTLNGKLMRMGKTSESIVCALLWQSKKVAVIAPRNARLFTVKEFERLGIKDYVVVDSMEDMEKPAKFYLLTYSWLKNSEDKHRIARRKGQSYLHTFYTEKKKQDNIVEHKCPHCSRTLERLKIKNIKSQETGFVLEKQVSWTKERGYMCLNKKCKHEINNGIKRGVSWSQTTDPLTGKICRSKPIKMGSSFHKYMVPPNDGMQIVEGSTPVEIAGEFVSYIDWNLRFHKDCKEKSVQGRYCHECKQADAVWVPAPYKTRVVKKERGKKVHLKDFFTAAIADEIHTIKSASSDTGKAVRAFRPGRRMGLTGTLMPNTPADAFWPLHWVFKGGSAVFPYHQTDGATEFYNEFCEYINIKRGHGLKDSRKMLPYLKNPIKFWELMSSKMVRRNYGDPLVQASLEKAHRYYPDIQFHRVESTMDPKQAALMVQAINHFEDNFNQYSAEATNKGHLLNQAMVVSQMVYLRIGATCPEYFNTKMAKLGKPAIYSGPLGGGKMTDIQNICATKTAIGEKVVVLSDFIEMRKSLSKVLIEHYPITFDGSWDDTERNEAFEAFLTDPTRKVFIAGTRQVREGTNLSSANTVICCDLLWEPGLQQQAWSRAFTPTAEKRTCEVYLLMAKNSIDEHVYNTFYAKVAAAEQALDRKVINRRAHQVDLRWFVDRVLSDREGLLAQLKEEGDAGIYISEKTFKELEDRDV